MFFNKKMIDVNTDKLDLMIWKNLKAADDTEDGAEYEKLMSKISTLVDMRIDLGVPKKEESNKKAIVSGAVQLASILVVLQYEKSNVVTSKVFSIATNMFKGS